MLKGAATASSSWKGHVLHFYKHRNCRKIEIYQWPTAHNFTIKWVPS